MNIAKLEEKLSEIVAECDSDSFIYDLMLAYGLPKATISKLKKGVGNKGKEEGQVVYKNKVFFHPVQTEDSSALYGIIDELRKDEATCTHSPRFIIVTDYSTLLAYDTKINDSLDVPFKDLPSYLDFFLPWAGREKYQQAMESPADIKAADRMARLYSEILKNNPDAEQDADARHSLNIFLSRLLFCYFSEDTEIFEKDIFTNAIRNYTEEDGKGLDRFLNELFVILNTSDKHRAGCPAYLKKFPYVNGGLFGDTYYAPKFTARARRMMLECGDLNWSEINPDIFGSMIQGVVDPEQRGNLGMHYTSVPNIMKVIQPLFLDDLWEEFEKVKDNPKKLKALHNRISKIRFFDPACGSGNFLIIAYKEIRKLEMELFKQQKRLLKAHEQFTIPYSKITLSQFYGIELADFAHEVAILSLWLAEHQMNVLFKEEFGDVRPTLPLREGGNIVCGNATRLNWIEVCPHEYDGKQYEVYVMGNPPYLGYTQQSQEQKADLQACLPEGFTSKSLDYIACWFFCGARYLTSGRVRCAFVTTNSICQGEQVALLWPHVLDGIEIYFAHQSFKWENNAANAAGVTCVIVGLSCPTKKQKKLFSLKDVKHVTNISPYLVEGESNYIQKQKKPISSLPQMVKGSQATDNGELLLSENEKKMILDRFPNSEKFLKKALGSQEFIKGFSRWCIWIEDADIDEAQTTIEIKSRIDRVRAFRMQSRKKQTVKLAQCSHRFAEIRHVNKSALIVPRHSSENREYIPIGFVSARTVILDSAQAVYTDEPFMLGLLSSRMHMAWVRAVAGRLKTDYRYSSVLCYNTFPVPNLSEKQKEIIEALSYDVLDARDVHLGKTMAELYDPDKMPDGLREAHQKLDLAVDRCYRKKEFESDSERLEVLFSMYEKMTAGKK